MDKTKDSPIPDKTAPPPSKEGSQKQAERRSTSDPQFVRGTIDPPTKK